MVNIIEQGLMRELLTIRDRKIALQAKEIDLLKKLLALKYQPKSVESCLHSLCPELPVDRATLETDEYDPKYDELIRRP